MTGFYDLPPARTLVAARLAAGLDADRVSTAHPSYLLHIRHTPAESRRSVAVVTGGGSGHEPFAAGFLGVGLLDAAVPGAVFASPRASAIADACFALALTQPPPAEILAVVLNYAGDRLSFARGVEQYRVRCPHGPTVRIVYVADDVSIPGSESPRGLAAVALLLKIVGAASEDCRSPQAVLELAQVVAKSAVTIGAALSPARLPGSSTFHSGHDTEGATESPHARKKTMKTTSLGLGIHNEPGYEALPLAPTESGLYARELVHEICTRLEQALLSDTYIAGAPAFVVLINNLGGVSELAMSVLVGAVASYMFGDNDGEGDAEAYPLRCVADDTRVYFCAGTLVSSLDMNGMSISVLPLTTDAEGLLLAPTDAPAWPRVYRVTRQSFTAAARAAEDAIAAPEGADWEDRSSSSAGRRRATIASRRVIEAVTTALLATADTLGALDALVGDGDFGFTLQSGCEAMLSAASRGLFNDSTPQEALLQLSQLAENSMGGTSGNLTQEFLAAAAAAANDGDWRRALEAGADAVQAAGGAAVGDRTALDALEPAAAAARHGRSAADVATAAEEAALATQNIPRARFGRSAHVNEASLLGNADPGAMAVGVALRAFADALGSLE